jgi:hypothetical protein
MSQRSEPTSFSSKFLDFTFKGFPTSLPTGELYHSGELYRSFSEEKNNQDEFDAKLTNQLQISIETLKNLNLNLVLRQITPDQSMEFNKLMAPKRASFEKGSQEVDAFEL